MIAEASTSKVVSMEFPRQEYWGWLLFLSPGDLPNLGIKARSPELQADSLLTELPRMPTSRLAITNKHISEIQVPPPPCSSFVLEVLVDFNNLMIHFFFNWPLSFSLPSLHFYSLL